MAASSKGRVLVAMSGGVDSSVTAYLLQRQGYECVGATMRLTDGADASGGSASSSEMPAGGFSDDIRDAAAVAARLGMEHHVLDCRREFASQVIDRFAEAYETGSTPNPCIECNRTMKFGLLLEWALELGCNWIATGHYARISARPDGRFALSRAADPAKDQSYVLYSLTQHQLAHTLLPLGGFSKDEVRSMAQQAGLGVASKGESQDICFIPDGDYRSFLECRAGHPLEAGDIVDEAGTVLGRHSGAAGYTIGQRKGLGVATGHPVYVCGKDMAANRVIVGPRESLACAALVAEKWNWIADPQALCGIDAAFEAQAKLRYRQEARPCTVQPLADGRVRLDFPEPEYAVAPGQAAVVYRGDEVLGGGTISAVKKR